MTDLTGQTVMITGASRGIGAATARHFAGLGARVALLARDGAALEALAGDIGDQAMALPCDMGDWAAVTAAVVATEARFGPIHVLINNAGLIDPIARLADSNPEDWGRVVDVNLKGVYHGLRAVLPGMLTARGGTVLNLSSGAASSALEGWSHYCATKAAVLALTRCADREYRDQGIRVIGLSPGTVSTGMQVQIRASGINPVSRMDPSAHIPADWVAQALAYLCGPGGDAHRGTDFSLKTAEGRAEAGLS